MIKEHPFATLCEILRSGNDEVLRIFNQYAVQKSNPVQSPSRFRELIAIKPIIKDDAKAKINSLIDKISKSGNNYFGVFQTMSEVLTADGIGKLLTMIGKDKIDEFLDGDNIQYLFRGMPIFKVLVEERANLNGTLTQGKYDISIVHTATQEKTFIDFETVLAKTLYLFFLLIPRKEIKNLGEKDKSEEVRTIRPVMKKILDDSFVIIGKSDKVDNDFKNDEVFGKKLNQAVSSIKRSIEKALDGRDMPDWYVVYFDRSDGSHSLSLPEEMIDISGCPSLIEFKKAIKI